MTAQDHLEVIDTTVQKTYAWINDLREELGGVSRHEAYHVLRGFLHVTRDRLVVDEAVQLGAQLPMLVRGLYYEGWDPSKTEKLQRVQFVDRFAREAGISDATLAEQALRAAARILRRHITEGEYAHVLLSLPRHIRALLDQGG